MIKKTNCVTHTICKHQESHPQAPYENNRIIEKNGKQYFVTGNLYIEIAEHFADNGKPLDSLIENVITFTANKQAS